MVKEELLEGLKVALSKGESLQKAIMSFFNAGYPKEEIEEAAGLLEAPSISLNQPLLQTNPFLQSAQIQQGYYSPGQPQLKQFKKSSQAIQRISGYGEAPRKTGTLVTVILVSLLVLLVGVLAAVFLFKDELSNLFNRTLGV